MRADAFSSSSAKPDSQFDYVYVAPPQYKGMWERAIVTLDGNPGWLSADAWVVAQIDPREYQAPDTTSLREFDQRRYGTSLLVFYARP